MSPSTDLTALTLRPAGPADARSIARLAQLDSSPVPRGPLLVAYAGDHLVAALATDSGVAIADPFARSAEPVAMLRLHAGLAGGAAAQAVPAAIPARLGRLAAIAALVHPAAPTGRRRRAGLGSIR